MPRVAKTTTKAKTASKSKAASKSKKTVAKAAPKVVAAPAPAPVVAPAPKVESSAPESLFADSFAKLSELTQRFQETINQSKQFAGEIRRLVSAVTRFEKKAQKRPRRRATGRTTESGITRPVRVSDEMCTFLNQPKGTLLARTVVTKHITTYIREQNLQNPDNRKQIFPDANLQAMLMPLRKEDRDAGYTFFNLQRYLKHHYQKVDAESKAATVNVSA